MHETKLDVLVVAPHPDDAELGMGGAILRMLDDGMKVGILDLTNGEPTPHGTEEIRASETVVATEILGVPWRENLGLPNRSLLPDLASRQKLAEVFRIVQPHWIFSPYWVDAHPDHVSATQLITDARFWAKLSKTEMRGERFHPSRIYCYYCVHLKMHPQPAFVLDISPYWEKKKAAIEAYPSQFVKGRETMNPSFIEQLETEARYWGKSIGVEFGEPFHSPEPIGLSSLSKLV